MIRRTARKIRKLMSLVSRSSYLRGLFFGTAAAIEHHAPLRSISAKTVLDIGANVGQFSLLARVLYPEAEIVAFEPLGAPARRFERLFHGDGRTRLLRLAAGHTNGSQGINVADRADSSSLLTLGDAQRAYFGTKRVAVENVEVRRLEEVLEKNTLARPVLVKLDVQGYELNALEGMVGILGSVDYIYVEVSFVQFYENQPLASDLIGWLVDRGFAFWGFYNAVYASDGRCLQSDLLFGAKGSV